MWFYLGRRITHSQRVKAVRPFSCKSCRHHARVRIFASGAGVSENSIHISERQTRTEAAELAAAAVDDDVRTILALLRCPKCGAVSDDASLTRG
jgi:hypothetical protein